MFLHLYLWVFRSSFNVTTYISLTENNKKCASLSKRLHCDHQPRFQNWRLTCIYFCVGRNSGVWDSKSPCSPAAPSPLPRSGWVPVVENQVYEIWVHGLHDCCEQGLPGIHRGVLPEDLGARDCFSAVSIQENTASQAQVQVELTLQ